MDLTEIHRQTKLSLRKLRYVLDHGILPGTRVKTDSSRVGHPRSFSPFEGYSIAVAAALLEAGLRRGLVARFFDAMTEIEWERPGPQRPKLVPLECSFRASVTPCVAEIADGRYLAVKIGRKEMPWADLQSPRFNRVRYEPRIVVTVDLARLRDEIRELGGFP